MIKFHDPEIQAEFTSLMEAAKITGEFLSKNLSQKNKDIISKSVNVLRNGYEKEFYNEKIINGMSRCWNPNWKSPKEIQKEIFKTLIGYEYV